MDCLLANHFQSLSCRGKTLCEYVWLGSFGSDLRSATKILNFKPSSAAEVPLWTYDGAATGQESASCSVVYLKPRSIHPDPLRYLLRRRSYFPSIPWLIASRDRACKATL